MQTRSQNRAFTLIELLAVIAIIGILAAITLPNLGAFKTNNMAAGTRQLLDDLTRARQLAMSQRTTVFMVFVPDTFWTAPFYSSLDPNEKNQADKLLDKQLVGYSLLSLRSLGDQPGRRTPRRLSPWKTLPDGVFIHPLKFANVATATPVLTVDTNLDNVAEFRMWAFPATNTLPLLVETTGKTGVRVSYIAFNSMGQLVDVNDEPTRRDELIPLAAGSALMSRDPNTKQPTKVAPAFLETPPGNATNAMSYNIIKVDWLTGRARVERREVQ